MSVSKKIGYKLFVFRFVVLQQRSLEGIIKGVPYIFLRMSRALIGGLMPTLHYLEKIETAFVIYDLQFAIYYD